jgi:uncharacterized protein
MSLRTLAFAALLAVGPLAAAEPAPADSAPFLWQVTTPKTTHYLVGSVHLLPASAHPLPAALEAAYAATQALTFETDLDAVSSPEMQGRMLGAAREDRPGGIQGQIGRRLYERLQKRAAGLGLPVPVCDEFRAWFCALTLELVTLQQAQFGVEFGIDQHFFVRAREDGRPVSGLESAESQVELFTRMPDALGKQVLAATLDERTYTSQTPADLLRIWRTGDLDALAAVVREMRRDYPQLHAHLLADRNRAWLPALAERFARAEPQLVIVGAAHLVGPDGLLALLPGRGIVPRAAPGVLELAEPPEAPQPAPK